MQSMQKKIAILVIVGLKNNILIDLVIENQLSTFLHLGLVSKNWQILQQISKICSYAQMEFCKEEKLHVCRVARPS